MDNQLNRLELTRFPPYHSPMENKAPQEDQSVKNLKFAIVTSLAIIGTGLIAHEIKGWILRDFTISSEEQASLTPPTFGMTASLVRNIEPLGP